MSRRNIPELFSRRLVPVAGLVISSCIAAVAAPSVGRAIETVTSSTMSQDLPCSLDLRLYDAREVTRLVFAVDFFTNATCESAIPGVTITFEHFPRPSLIATGFPEAFRGPATLATCTAEIPHFECPPELGEVFTFVYEAEGPGGELKDLPAICPERLDCSEWPCEPEGPFVADRCGDSDDNGLIVAKDALLALRAAVGLQQCAVTLCDVDGSGGITATDARSILAYAVGLTIVLDCPPPCTINPP
ncbi:MAG TPA: hypothetical protein VEL28_19255 [Candidatus Binatia bacterium]|nr:hypothetical protein [Candidatus Binatia bacterium]